MSYKKPFIKWKLIMLNVPIQYVVFIPLAHSGDHLSLINILHKNVDDL